MTTKSKIQKLNTKTVNLLKSAGFIPDYNFGEKFNLVYWKRGDIRIVLFRDQKFTVKQLVEYTVEQTKYVIRHNLYRLHDVKRFNNLIKLDDN